MKIARTLTSAALFAVALAMPFAADAKLSRAGASSVTFNAVGTMRMAFSGSTSDLTVVDDATKITITVPLANLTTNMALRDKHMRDHLEVAKFPTAELEVQRAALRFPKGGEAAGDVDAIARIHGVARPVKVHYTAKPAGGAFEVSGRMTVNMTEHGIDVPKYMGLTVNPRVDIVVAFTAKDAG